MAEHQDVPIEKSVRIAAPVETVWSAISEADHLARWFMTEARVTPGEGGSVWMKWNEDMQFETPIAAWVPNQRLRLIHCEPNEHVPLPVTVEYALEGDGGETILRLTHHGLSDEGAWAALYDGTSRGWDCMLPALKHYVERHLGSERDAIFFRHALGERSVADGWRSLFAEGGLIASAPVDELRPGDPITLRLDGADDLAGRVRRVVAPMDLETTLSNWNDGLMRIQIDDIFDRRDLYLTVWTWGDDPARVATLRDRLGAMLERVFPT